MFLAQIAASLAVVTASQMMNVNSASSETLSVFQSEKLLRLVQPFVFCLVCTMYVVEIHLSAVVQLFCHVSAPINLVKFLLHPLHLAN